MKPQLETFSKPNYDKSKRPYSFPNTRDAATFSKHFNINDDASNAKRLESKKDNWKQGW